MTNSEQKIALVTGASRGIGRAIALRLAADGMKVICNYVGNEAAANAVQQEITASGGQASLARFDIADEDGVQSAVDGIIAQDGRLDVVVNNAGLSKDGLFVRMKTADWDTTIDTNLKGAFLVSRAASKHMMKARSGRIVNISSVVGQMGNAGQVPYVSSKAGLIGFTKALARELASRNILVNAVAPGFIETDMTAALDEKTRESHMGSIPLGRYGAPEEVAGVVSFLCGPDSAYITGHVISINGGMYM
jgi:3-oxoacyl-[acyl-carrier protein] reductase